MRRAGHARWQPRRQLSVPDGGAATLEYVGIITVVVALVLGTGAAIAAASPTLVADVRCQVGRVISGGGSCATTLVEAGAGNTTRRDTARDARGDRRNDARGGSGTPAPGTPGTPGSPGSATGLGTGVPGTSVQWPGVPPWQPHDVGAGPYASQDPTLADRATDAAAEAAANAMAGVWPNASRNLLHFLGNSGAPLQQDVDAMLRDVPDLTASADSLTQNYALTAVQQAQAAGATGSMTFPISSPWQGFYITPQLSQDWFYAVGGIEYGVVGQVTVYPPATAGDPWTYATTTRVEIRDQYNWDGGKSTQIGPFTITDAQLAELHRAGLAQEFTVTGSSGTRTTAGKGP